jgi:hypothetical protein
VALNAEGVGDTRPKQLADGLSGNTKALSGGTFAYQAEGKYVIATSSTTLSGVANNSLLFMGNGGFRTAIMQFRQSFGAKTVTAFRSNRFSWTSTKSYSTAGATLASRPNWVAATTGGGNAAAAPSALNEKMWSQSASAVAQYPDNAANPTRAIPGELVMKVDWVTLTVASGGDFFDYAAITGM